MTIEPCTKCKHFVDVDKGKIKTGCYYAGANIKNKNEKIAFTEKRIKLLTEWTPKDRKFDNLRERCIKVLNERIIFLQKGDV